MTLKAPHHITSQRIAHLYILFFKSFTFYFVSEQLQDENYRMLFAQVIEPTAKLLHYLTEKTCFIAITVIVLILNIYIYFFLYIYLLTFPVFTTAMLMCGVYE